MNVYMNVQLSAHGHKPWVDVWQPLPELKKRRIIVHDFEEGKKIADAWLKGDYTTPGKII